MSTPLVNSSQEAEMAHYVDSLEYPFCQDVSKYEKIVKVSSVGPHLCSSRPMDSHVAFQAIGINMNVSDSNFHLNS